MPQLRSRTSTHGRTMAGARALWRATGMTDDDFGKPIVAIANSFTQFVPGHVHLKDLGQLVAGSIAQAGGVGREFNTIAVDDGIAMGHSGMLYSLPSRELIADAVEYMVNAHCADALVCISNCDKITPGMLMAALRLNIPTVFVSGGPMEAGKTVAIEGIVHSKIDPIDAMIASSNGDDDSVLPRNIATKAAFENAVALDVAMGGSTNTVLHLLAAAREGEIDMTMSDIDSISRRVPCLSKVAPNSPLFHMEDVHRAGGIPAILGELDRAGLLQREVHAIHSPSLQEWLGEWDIRSGSATQTAFELFHAAPGGVRTTEAFSTQNRWGSLDTDATEGCIRDREHAYTADGGLAVLHGNIALDGCVVKTAGVPEAVWQFTGTARVFESQDDAVAGILDKTVTAGDVVVIRYEGPKGGPGMQ